jgi:O-antigen ligase
MELLAVLRRWWLRPTEGLEIDPALQVPWVAVWWGLLALPLSPAIGGVTIGLAAIAVYRQRWSAIRRDRIILGGWVIGALMLLALPGSLNLERAALGLANFLPFFWAFGALSHLITARSELIPLARAIVWGSIPVTVLGLGQLFWGWRGPVRIPPIIDWILAPGGNPLGRMSSSFEYANVTASYLGVALALALGLLVLDHLAPNPAISPVARRVSLGAMGIATLLLLLAIALTNSRSGWALAAIDLLAAGLYVDWFWLLAAAGAAIAIVLGAAFGPAPAAGPLRAIVPRLIWGRLNDALYPDRPEATLRTSQWDFAWDLAARRPLTGWGFGNFPGLYQAATQNWLGHPHNLVLMLAAEAGWPVAIGLTGWVGWILARAGPLPAPARSREAIGLAAWLLAFGNLAAFHLLDVTLFDLRVNLVGWLLLAAIHGTAPKAPSDRDTSGYIGIQ